MPAKDNQLEMRRLGCGNAARACATLMAFLFATSCAAATFVVDSPADVADAVPGDGVCETAPGNGVCTLRAAVMESNALPGADTIQLQANVTYLLTATGAGDAGYSLKINDSVTIAGAGRDSSVIDGNSTIMNLSVFTVAPCVGGGFTCDANHPPIVASISDLAITHGNGVVAGAIDIQTGATVALADCAISANHAAKYGGGIYNQGSLTIDRCAIIGNSTGTSPGGGGGIDNAYGSLTLRNATVSGNSAVTGGGIVGSGGTLAIIDSTISGNSASGNGGGIYSATATALYNATVADNQANSDGVNNETGGGVYAVAGFAFNAANSIISGNTVAYLGYPDPIIVADDCNGTLTSQGNDIITSVDAGYCTLAGSWLIADPLLGPLQDNGGPTLTHALLQGSPAIDAGNNGGCTDNFGAILATDQRGVQRPQGARCDIGAYEYNDAIFGNGFDS